VFFLHGLDRQIEVATMRGKGDGFEISLDFEAKWGISVESD
jgi:hypothetical protein